MFTPLRSKEILADYGSFSLGSCFMIVWFSVTWALGTVCYLRWEEPVADLFPVFTIFNILLVGERMDSER